MSAKDVVLGTVTEADFQAQVVELATLRGWLAYHTFDSRRSASGFPDLVMVRQPEVLFVELKREGKGLDTAQLAWRIRLEGSQQRYYLWRPGDWDEIEKVLR